MLCAASIVHAELAQVGPVDPANGFPFWYQDTTGLAMDLCLPNATELANGACLLLPADIPDPAQPISFPANFPQEAFWWAADATMDVNGGKATLGVGLEAAFLNGPVVPGDQISFARVRIRAATPHAGTYKVIYPFGEKSFTVTSGGSRTIDYTLDVGFVPGNFALALTGPIGPYLLASDAPGGAPLPFVVLPGGNTFLADATLTTAVTGSPFNTNYFRIEGPDIGGAGIDFVEVSQFTLLGRVHLGLITDTVNVDRATYTRDISSAVIDVCASVIPAIGNPPALLSFTGAGIPGRIMIGDGQYFHGESIPADPAVLPPSVFVANNADHPPTIIETPLTDIVTITQATFNAGTLTVMATSSDGLVPPVLAVDGFGPMTGGVLVQAGVAVPPAHVTVISSAGGSDTRLVDITPEAPVGPVAVDDFAITDADQPVLIDVMANDPGPGVALQILGTPAHGTAALVACPPPSLSPSCIQYSPTLYYFGADQITYVIQDGASLNSNVATASITVNFVNHNPVANDDVAGAGKNASVIINVLANDVDPDGNGTLDPASVTIIDPPAAGTAVVDPGTGAITYTAPDLEGVFTFTYTVNDTSLPVLTSNVATVTVNVVQADVLTITKVVFKTDTSQWVVVGTTLIPGPNNNVTVHLGPDLAGTVIGSVVPDAFGAWKLVVKNSTILPDASGVASIETSRGAQELGFTIKIK